MKKLSQAPSFLILAIGGEGPAGNTRRRNRSTKELEISTVTSEEH
jgi:hypothetical protein